MPWVEEPPCAVAALMLDQLFGREWAAGDTADRYSRAYPLTDSQEAAARRAAGILARWGGVLIADSVGLGKTYIALALIQEGLARGDPVLVTVPAALRPGWRRLLRRFRTWHHGSTIQVVSHAQLSRGGYSESWAGQAGLVVVDEAHRFRNPKTRRYEALTTLRGCAPVVLLTATPVNNGLGDLHHLLRLFATDDAFLELGVPSLEERFAVASPDDPGLRRIVQEVMVRRTRAVVRAWDVSRPQQLVPVRFPRRAPPQIVSVWDPRVPRLTRSIARLGLAPHALGSGTGDGNGEGVVALVRMGLLKRLESGAPSLRTSIRRQLSLSRDFLDALESGYLLRPSAPVGGGAARDADLLQLALIDLVAEPWPPGVDPAPVRESVRRDVARLRAMLRLLDGPDPKLDALVERVAPIAAEKVVLFTEFRDTAEALWNRLMERFAVGRIDGEGAWLGGGRAGRSVVVEHFAPRANDVRPPVRRERVDILIVTDVLAEGVNLQDARHAICYDLPWNPVRLMQRIGRVDRLGSPHEEVVPHIFLPAAGLEEILGLTRRLREKIGTIAATVGEEDGTDLLARLRQGGAEALAVLDRVEARHEDPMETLRMRWQLLGRPAPSPAPTGAALACGVSPPTAPTLRALVLARFRRRPWILELHADGHVREPGHGTVALLTAALEGAVEASTSLAPQAALAERAAAAVRAHLHALDCAVRAPRRARPGDPPVQLARRLRRAMTSPGAWVRPDLIARADRALQQLARPLDPAIAARARRLAAEMDDAVAPATLIEQVEALLDGAREGRPAADGCDGPEESGVRVVAVMVVVPDPAAAPPRPAPRG